MINPRNASPNCFLYGGGSSQGLQIYGMAAAGHEGSVSSSSPPPPPPPLGGMNNSVMGAQYSCSLLYSFSVLKDKFHQVQSLISIFDQGRPESMAMVVAGVGNLIQEVIAASSSILYSCQQMGYGSAAAAAAAAAPAPAPGNSASTAHGLPQPSGGGGGADPAVAAQMEEERGQGFYSGESLDWFGDNYNNINQKVESTPELPQMTGGVSRPPQSPKAFDIVELEAEDLLAKYTHYCQVCGKGFKRDANLRMHMRAHGDEYKSNAALTNPVKNSSSSSNNNNVNVIQMGLSTTTNAIHHDHKNNNNNNNNNNPGNLLPRKYSCPQEGCRWNRRHAKFQPLKSMICVKNHYKRSHCPKMYICKRCNQKRFSVLSDLRTHEKHCGDLKWLCSCGTTFSRKDKLMGHVALFLGHTPTLMTPAPSSKAAVNFHDQNLSQFQFQ